MRTKVPAKLQKGMQSMLLEIFGPLTLVGLVFAGLFVLNHWTRAFSELLWHLPLAPMTIIASVVVGILLVSLTLGLITIFPAVGPFSMLIQLAVLPFVAVPMANGIAYILAHFRNRRVENIAWRHYIYGSTRARQRDAYDSYREHR